MTKLILAALVTGALTLSAAEKTKPKVEIDFSKLPPPSQAKGVTYSGEVHKIFEASCVKCHGPEKAKGKLRLDSLEGVLKGGEDGKVIVPGKSAQSRLVHSISYLGDKDFFMPPPGNKANIPRLSAEDVGLIRAWIDQGAK